MSATTPRVTPKRLLVATYTSMVVCASPFAPRGAALCLCGWLAAAQACAGDAPERDVAPETMRAGDAASVAAPDAGGRAPEAGGMPLDANVPDAPPDRVGDVAAPDAGSHGTDAGPLTPDALSSAADASPLTACGGQAFCTDFEDQTGSALGGAWHFHANCSGDGKAAVDSSQAHSGARSVRVQSSGGTCNHIFATPRIDLTALSASLWVRFYVGFDRAPPEAGAPGLPRKRSLSSWVLCLCSPMTQP